ncbi:MAG: domain containing protein [Bacteroidota bacterium]|nr:domain containing protein [Bacteroidota bacterium]
MKKLFALLFFTTFILGHKAHAICYKCTNLSFKENKNQWNKEVLYRTELHSGSIFLCRNNFTYLVADTSDLSRIRHSHHPHNYRPDWDYTVHLHAFRTTFQNSNLNCKVTGGDKLTEYENYYIGKDRSHWASHVNVYHQVVYNNLYDHIDLEVGSQDVNLKYDFIVKKGANASDIQINYEGTDGISLNNDELTIKTSVGSMIDTKPYAYQVVNGVKNEIKCLFMLSGKTVSFVFPDGYDKSMDLVIDPILIFSTFSGSTADNFGYSATYDSRGNAYVAGTVFQAGQFPVTLGAFQTTWAGGIGFGQTSNFDGTGTDIGITKYDSAGTTRLYSTYLGGDGDELPHSLIVNSNDELFVFGTTSSDNFPVTPTAFDTSYGGGTDPGIFYGIGVHYQHGSDLFITRFNQTGTALIASTYVGGTSNDGLTYPEYSGLNYNYADEVRGEINIDRNNNVYIATCTRSADFPVTAGAYQTTYKGATDGVILKLNNNLTNVIWGTYLGGSGEDAIYSVDFDNNDDLYVAGGTESTNFPTTTGVVQPTNHGGRAEGFVAHISKDGTTLLQSTCYGSAGYDQIYFVRTNKSNNVYVLGQTDAPDTTYIHNALYGRPNSGQFISKFSPKLDTVVWSTAFGSGRGRPDISPTAFLVDVCNKTYVSGWGSDFSVLVTGAPALSTAGLDVTSNAYQAATDSQDFYVMVMEDDASALAYATYFGSSDNEEHVDGGTSRFDRKGIIYQSVCAGCDGKSSFPTTAGVVSNTNNSPNCNNAVFKFDLQLPLVVADFYQPTTGCAPYNVAMNNVSKTVLSPTYQWDFGDGGTSSQANPSHLYTQAGVYNIQLIVSDPGSCNLTDTIRKQVLILAHTPADTLASATICRGGSVQIGINSVPDSAVTYTWTPTNYLTESNISNPFASPPQTTGYTLLVSNGVCTDTFFEVVKIFRDTLNLQGANAVCAGDTLRLSVSNTLGNQSFTYSWQPVNAILSGANTANPVVDPTQNTTFVVTATDSNGCHYSDSILVNITSTLPNVNAIAVPDTILYGDTAQLNLTTSGSVTSFSWKPDSTLSATNIVNPVADPKQTTTYYVEVSDGNSCKRDDSVTVYVVRTSCAQSNIYIPDAFSPNGDGKNDVLYVRGNEISNLYFAIYDRWGQRVFESRDITKGWDGTFKGKKMDAAVFGYYAEGACPSGEKFLKKGNVTLIR